MVMAVIAILVAVAILGLAFRRFVLVRISPDPRSWTSGVVALFIFLLMLTYLNGISANPIAPRLSWWLHAGIILAFPHLILRSKHFHILMAPVSLYFKTERLGEFAPLDLEGTLEADVEEVSLGLEKVSQLPWKMRMDFLTCVECRRCTDNCPAARAGNELDPRGFVLAGRRALKANGGAEHEISGTVISDSALGFCATCGACENGCPVGVEHLQLIVGAKRAQALSTGQGVVASDFFRAIETYGNPFKVPRVDRQKLIEDLALPKFSGAEGEWLLWLGCVWGYNPELRPAVKAFQQVLTAAGLKWGVLEEEPCCGHHSRRQGEECQFQELARRSRDLLRQQGVRRVVTPCPHCLHTLRHEHIQLPGVDGQREDGASIQFVHYSELLNTLITSGNLRLAANGAASPVSYHDPCYLARYEGICDAPRAVLAATGATLHELPHRRGNALCCGGGAAGFVRELDNGQRLDRPRRTEIVQSGVSVLVTACPECRMMLGAAVDQTKDLVEVVAECIRAGNASATR